MAVDVASPNERRVFTPQEILEDPAYEAPLFAGGVRCHGGFDSDGSYCSPRTLFRGPAIDAWQSRLEAEGHDLIEVPRELMPPQYPNVDQSVLLVKAGVVEPVVRALTLISIVEGFGAIIRDVKVPDLSSLIREPIEGTALAHLDGGLFEAHARDEAGYRDQGGHKQMWEAARDLAFENPPVPGDVLMRMMGRRGRRGERERPFPQLDEALERMLGTMVNVLVVEVFAEGTFQWGKSLLGKPEVSADPKGASDMVSYIQADEKPHVEYLRTALSEVRARTLATVDGGSLAGRQVVDHMLHATLRQMTRSRQEEQREETREGLREALASAPGRDALIEEFEGLETPWSPPSRTGFEPDPAAATAS